jgi:hypothetical protein
MKIAERAQYEISVDGTVRTHRDTLEIALEAANVLKACNPYSKVVVSDLSTARRLSLRHRMPWDRSCRCVIDCRWPWRVLSIRGRGQGLDAANSSALITAPGPTVKDLDHRPIILKSRHRQWRQAREHRLFQLRAAHL